LQQRPFVPRYRLDVDQLVVAADIEFDLGPNCQKWLAIAPTQNDAQSRLSALADKAYPAFLRRRLVVLLSMRVRKPR